MLVHTTYAVFALSSSIVQIPSFVASLQWEYWETRPKELCIFSQIKIIDDAPPLPHYIRRF